VEINVATIAIDGNWEGQFSFDPNKVYPELPPPVSFVFTARSGWFGSVVGEIQDNPELGLPAAAAQGRLAGIVLRFKKRYPTTYLYVSGRVVTLAKYLESEHGLRVDHPLSGPSIDYEGWCDYFDTSFSGTWYDGPRQITFRSGGKRRCIVFPAVSGRWSMQRSDR
jgi:hypothetical protein